MSLEKLLRKNMWKTWKWDDLLAAILILMTVLSLFAVALLVRMDPAFKRIRAREECRILAQALELLAKTPPIESDKRKVWSESIALLYTWEGTSTANNADKWPYLSPSIRPWRHYGMNAGYPPTRSQEVKEFLKEFRADNLREQDLLLKARSVGFDPWEKTYVINIGNMSEKENTEPGSRPLTWVLSAGPNGMLETPDFVFSDEERLSGAGLVPGGDDIGCVIAADS